jgi:hypothetical protein
MGYPIPGTRGYLTGLGAITPTSITTTGAISGAAITGTGRITGAGFTSSITGAAGTPSYNWSADPTLGLYDAAGKFTVVASGTHQLEANASFWRTDGNPLSIVGISRHDAAFRMVSRVVDIAAVGSTVSPVGAPVVELTLSAGAIVSTAAPFMIDGSTDQEITLQNMDSADALTLANDGGTATNLRLLAATRVLAPLGGYLKLRFSATSGLWQEIGFG